MSAKTTVTLCVIAAMPVLYVLSVGPLMWLMAHGYLPLWLAHLYDPLWYIGGKLRPLGEFVDWYIMKMP